MTDQVSNDNDAGSDHPASTDHGHAAILLVESLIHGLIARSVISVSDAIGIIESTTEIIEEIKLVADDRSSPTQSPVTILESIRDSLGFDLPKTTK